MSMMTEDRKAGEILDEAPAPEIEFPHGDDLTTDEKFAIFEKWLISNGCTYPKLELKDYGNEVRGCHTTNEVEYDETIMNIPLKCMITVEMGKLTTVGRKILAANIELDAPKHIFIMVFMLMDRRDENSFFKPYYDILPPTLRNMPVFWNEEELSYLKGSFLLTQIEERNLAMQADYRSICSIAPEFAEIATLDDFKWARMCVCSRNFGLVVNGLRTAAMVPYADMLNHYRPRETKWQFEDSCQAFTITTLRRIGIGAQIYDSYGQKCNHRFLLNYGFSVENNEESDGTNPNEVPLLFSLDSDDPLHEEKCRFWRRDGSFPSRRIRICIGENENSRAMFQMLRIIVADEEEFRMLTETPGASCSNLRDATMPLNVKNESRSMQLLKSKVQDYMSRYPTSYEEDVRRLAVKVYHHPKSMKKGTPEELVQFSNERHAVIQVKGEKEVLAFLLDFTDTVIRLLGAVTGEHSQFAAEMQTVFDTKHPFIAQHCKYVLGRLRSHQDLNGVASRDRGFATY